jgi:hypothetical protein
VVVIKTNPSQATDVLIHDMGILIPASGGSETFTDVDNLDNIRLSQDLRLLTTDNAYGVGSSTLIVNDGASDIPQAQAETFITQAVGIVGPTGLIGYTGVIGGYGVTGLIVYGGTRSVYKTR